MSCRALRGLLRSGQFLHLRVSDADSIQSTPYPRWLSSSKPRSIAAPIEIANVTEDDINSARAYCSNMLRNYDAPSHTLLAFIPPPAQTAYLSLRALNVSLAMVGDSTSAPAVGAMRMQFWRDSISRALDFAPPKEPIAILLAHAAGTLYSGTDGSSRLSKSWLLRLVNEREKYLNNPPYPDLASLESYAENTYSTLLYLTLSALPVTSITADHLASHIGKAQGIAAILRGLPLLAFPSAPNHHSNRDGTAGGLAFPPSPHQGMVNLPLDVMAEAGVREEDVLRQGAEAPGLRDAVFAVATRANDHLITAREMLKNLRAGEDAGHEFEHAEEPEHQYNDAMSPTHGHRQGSQWKEVERAFGVLMPAVSTQTWLDRLQKCDFDAFNASLRKSDWKLPMKAYWSYKRTQF